MIQQICKCDPVLLILFQYQTQGISIQELAQKISWSIPKIEQHLHYLRELGYKIDYITQIIFLLDSPSIKISPEKIVSKIKYPTDFFYLNKSISTNTLAMEMQEKNAFLLFTKEQLAGQGRAGRIWTMQRDKDIAITFSMPTKDITEEQISSVLYISSLAVFDTLDFFAPHRLMIKWPNDILSHENQKISGILINSVRKDNDCERMIIGVGININSNGLPEDATSLMKLLNREVDIHEVYAKLINTFYTYWYNFSIYRDQLRKRWQQNMCWIGEKVSFKEYNQEYMGIFKSVDIDGSIIIQINQKDYKFMTGDLTQFRVIKNS
ncbi:MAG: biotin--[acetyl-CoA-carboxylase] ligase [Brevinema sp.]